MQGTIGDVPRTSAPAGAVTRSEEARAASSGARLNVPLNVENWKSLQPDQVEQLTWFHQHALDRGLSLDECAEALGYDRSVVWRVLKGVYEGSWDNVMDAIASYRRIAIERGRVQTAVFVETGVTRRIWGALNYALAQNTITLVEGESRMGKSTAAIAWRDANNHGRSVYVIAPAYGGTKALLRDIAAACGVNKNLSAPQMHESILRAFNRNRILIVDEAHRLLPGDRRSNPVNLEILRDIHDRTGCALALLATARFGADLKRLEYQYEQLLGRMELTVKLPRRIQRSDYLPIVRQYLPQPSEATLSAADQICNDRGRLGVLVGVLKIASRIAGGGKARVTNEHFFKALKTRELLSTEAP